MLFPGNAELNGTKIVCQHGLVRFELVALIFVGITSEANRDTSDEMESVPPIPAPLAPSSSV
ncbi:MAG: hypothetical protein K2X29_12445 [Candidatus Obscuribacterales bacterium]|nr:hypothetical protein [Candidatus Obscuribacterales bacterium]